MSCHCSPETIVHNLNGNCPRPMDPTLKRLISASTAGDLASVQAIFSEWKSTQDPAEAAKPKYPNHEMQRALEAAVRQDHLEVITYFLQQRFRISHKVVKNAIEARSTTALELLLTYGWRINHRSTHRLPSICVAISRNDLPLVTWFLAHGASPNVRYNSDTMSTTPLTCAVISACPAIVSLLLDQGARVDRGNVLSALCESKQPGRLYILGLLIQRGAPVNAVDEDDSQYPPLIGVFEVQELGAPLHRAVDEGRVAIAAALLAHGADKAVRDSKGRTPVELAKELGRAEMVALLEAE